MCSASGPFAGQLEELLSHLLRGTLGYVDMDVLPLFIAWHVSYLSPPDRGVMLDRYREYLCKFNAQQPLKMPRLDDFDAIMRPLQK